MERLLLELDAFNTDDDQWLPEDARKFTLFTNPNPQTTAVRITLVHTVTAAIQGVEIITMRRRL